MINAYLTQAKQLISTPIDESNTELLNHAIWIDLFCPSREEKELVEKNLKFNLPTREEMQEIEPSSRLYKDDGLIVMTATMLAKSTSPEPKTDAVNLLLSNDKLITIRYVELHAFTLFISRLSKFHIHKHNSNYLVIELLEATIDRLADILERVGKILDDYSQAIFRTNNNKLDHKTDYYNLIKEIGASGDINTKVRESLVSLERLVSFFAQMTHDALDSDMESRLNLQTKDIKALGDHNIFLSNKVNFLLDATLGMVNIEQNNIIKIFSIAAVIFLPPTLIASIYGMNFEFMPELHTIWGYPISIAAMLLAAWLPYKFFKIKKWL